MIRRAARPWAIAVVGALLACGDDQSSPPTSPDFQIGVGSACDYNQVKKLGQTLFGSKGTGADLIKAIVKQPANSAAATSLGFDVMREIAALARPATLPASTVTTAAKLTVQLIACMDVMSTGPQSDLTVAVFEQALGENGIYEVRGGPKDPTGNVIAHNGRAGVRPASDFQTWLGGGRGLFFGREISSFTVEALGGYAYDVSMLREVTRSGGTATIRPLVGAPGTVALCTDDAEFPFAQLRVQRHSTILPVSANFLDCQDPSPGATSALPAGASWARRLFHYTRSLLEPEPLYASTALALAGKGGSAADFSPFEVVNPADAKLGFKVAPVDARVGQQIPIQVAVTGNGGTAWQGVLVRLEAFNNNGVPAQLLPTPTEATTNELGIATFSVSLTKPGAYRIRAITLPSVDEDVDSFQADTVVAGKINIRP